MSRRSTGPRPLRSPWTAFREVENWAEVFGRRDGGRKATAASRRIDGHFRSGRYFANNRYAAIVVEMAMPAGGNAVHLLVMPRDNRPGGGWSDLQRVKNEVVGAEVEMYQLHPKATETVDEEHTYHLWGYRDADWRLPLGLDRALHFCLAHDFQTAQGTPVRGWMYLPTEEGAAGRTEVS